MPIYLSQLKKQIATRIMPCWKLDMKIIWLLVASGKDDKERFVLFNKLIEKYSLDKRKTCLQIGVPSDLNKKYGENFTSLDLYDKRDCIDIRADLAKTPFKNNQFDFIVCNAILEHVKDPFACSQEIYRIAKPGAKIWVEVPFLEPFHPFKGWNEKKGLFSKLNDKGYSKDEYYGGDYWRFTPQGLRLLMKPFKLIKILSINWGGICFFGEKLK